MNRFKFFTIQRANRGEHLNRINVKQPSPDNLRHNIYLLYNNIFQWTQSFVSEYDTHDKNPDKIETYQPIPNNELIVQLFHNTYGIMITLLF